MTSSFLVAFLVLSGSAFILVAAVGLLRMEDVYTRLHGASKAAPFGAMLILIAVARAAGTFGIGVRVAVIGAFLLLTAPIAAHFSARAAYLDGHRVAPSAPGDLEGKYDREKQVLHSISREDQAGAPSPGTGDAGEG